MKTLYVKFKDSEYKQMLTIKNKWKRNWHDFLMILIVEPNKVARQRRQEYEKYINR